MQDIILLSFVNMNSIKRKKEASRGSLAEYVRQQFFEDIFNMRISCGAHLRTEELAQRYGVTRTPVREALQQLEHEGIVELVPNAGFKMRVFSYEDLLDLYEIRAMVEGRAVRQLVQSGAYDDEFVALLRIKGNEACSADNFSNRREADQLFHQLICNRCGSRIIRQFTESFRGISSCFTVSNCMFPDKLVGRDAAEVHAEHLAIVDAIANGDAKLSEKLMVHHVKSALRSLQKAYLKGSRETVQENEKKPKKCVMRRKRA